MGERQHCQLLLLLLELVLLRHRLWLPGHVGMGCGYGGVAVGVLLGCGSIATPRGVEGAVHSQHGGGRGGLQCVRGIGAGVAGWGCACGEGQARR